MTVVLSVKAELNSDTLNTSTDGSGELCLLRNVPADVCTQCGDVFFGPTALRASGQRGKWQADRTRKSSLRPRLFAVTYCEGNR